MGARSILPLILLLVFVGILAAVGFIVYSIVQDVGKNTREKMERKNIAFTKDGMKVQVREIKDEAYKDRTQRCVCALVKFPFLGTGLIPFPTAFLSTCGTTLPSPLIRADFGICPGLRRPISRMQRSASKAARFTTRGAFGSAESLL